MANMLDHQGCATVIERRSRFEALALPCTCYEDALTVIEACKTKHPLAGHHVFALRLDPAHERFSDAGEPQGSAGRPCLSLLQQLDLVRTLVVVSRVFGGTKLGFGGLVRAYRGAAKAALEIAEPTPFVEQMTVCLTLEHHEWPLVRPLLEPLALTFQLNFTQTVRLELKAPSATLYLIPPLLEKRLNRSVAFDKPPSKATPR